MVMNAKQITAWLLFPFWGPVILLVLTLYAISAAWEWVREVLR